jgi:hypothetical protein
VDAVNLHAACLNLFVGRLRSRLGDDVHLDPLLLQLLRKIVDMGAYPKTAS